MRIGRGNRSTRRNPDPAPLCPAQIPHDLTWYRTRAATVGSQQLTACAMTRPQEVIYSARSVSYLSAVSRYSLLLTCDRLQASRTAVKLITPLQLSFIPFTYPPTLETDLQDLGSRKSVREATFLDFMPYETLYAGKC
jgi:hypothetical protein